MPDKRLALYLTSGTSSVALRPPEIAEGISMSLVSAMVGLALAMPAYFLATAGLLVRSLISEPRND